MTKRTHHQISALYMGDSESIGETYMGREWIELDDFKFSPRHIIRVTTSDGRVYISEPSGLFYEVIKIIEDGKVICPLVDRKRYVETLCIECDYYHKTSINNQTVHCKACGGE